MHHILYSRNILWGEMLANYQQFAKLKPCKLVVTINNLLANLLIRQTFLPKSLSTFTKHCHRHTFPLYGSSELPMQLDYLQCMLVVIINFLYIT